MAWPAISGTLAARMASIFPEEEVMIRHAYSKTITTGAAVIAVAAAASGARLGAANASATGVLEVLEIDVALLTITPPGARQVVPAQFGSGLTPSLTARMVDRKSVV